MYVWVGHGTICTGYLKLWNAHGVLYIEQMSYNIHFFSIVQNARYGHSMLTADICTCTAAVGSSIGTAVGVSVSVTFVVSFSMGVLAASVL